MDSSPPKKRKIKKKMIICYDNVREQRREKVTWDFSDIV